LAITFVFGGVS